MVTFAEEQFPKKKILITSALPYVNNVPHLGNIIGCVLSADVFSRYCKLKKYDSLYVCGTDEHGTATETKALEEGLSPRELCDKYHALHKKIYSWFNINFDVFGRTSTKEHEEITQNIFLQLWHNGFIKENTVEQLYCTKDQKFLADRFVEGECPHCHFKDARGDQCDSCSHLLNATELVHPRCKTCGTQPIIRESDHLFLDLESLQLPLTKWIASAEDTGFWRDNAITTTDKWLKEGLKPRAISRDLKWGVPIPLDNYREKVFYVWFDAPIGYLSITAKDRPDWKEWWQGKDVKLYQFMAKDNIPFHTILFPATLIGTKEHYTMLHHIDSTEYLNYEDAKFSKSRKTGVFGDDAIETGIPADVWRYYLLVNRPENSDTVFTWKDFQDKLNNELVANLGNLVNRTVTFISKYFDGKVYPTSHHTLSTREHVQRIDEYLENVDLKKALHEVMALAKIGNKYFQDNEPWKQIKEDKAAAQNTLSNLFGFIRDLSIIVEPFLPTTAENIWKQLNLPPLTWNDIGAPVAEHQIGEPKLLFTKLEDDRVTELKTRYQGRQDERKEEDTTADRTLFSKLNLTVAEIKEVKLHPNAEKLFILKIDCGEERQLVAGLKQHYTPEELIGKKIIIVKNLEPAVLRGEKSQGMLLAAGDPPGILFAEKTPPGFPIFTDSTKGLVGKYKTLVKYEEFSKVPLEAKEGIPFFGEEVLKSVVEDVRVDKNGSGKIR